MRGEHDLGSFIVGEIEDSFQHLNDKIHWCDLVIVDDDAIERFELRLGIFDDLNFGDDLENHFITSDNRSTLVPCIGELGHFLLAEFNVCCLEIFLDVLRIIGHRYRDDARLIDEPGERDLIRGDGMRLCDLTQ